MRTTDSLTKAGQWLDPREQGPTIAYTNADATAELAAVGEIISRR